MFPDVHHCCWYPVHFCVSHHKNTQTHKKIDHCINRGCSSRQQQSISDSSIEELKQFHLLYQQSAWRMQQRSLAWAKNNDNKNKKEPPSSIMLPGSSTQWMPVYNHLFPHLLKQSSELFIPDELKDLPCFNRPLFFCCADYSYFSNTKHYSCYHHPNYVGVHHQDTAPVAAFSQRDQKWIGKGYSFGKEGAAGTTTTATSLPCNPPPFYFHPQLQNTKQQQSKKKKNNKGSSNKSNYKSNITSDYHFPPLCNHNNNDVEEVKYTYDIKCLIDSSFELPDLAAFYRFNQGMTSA